jgi:hypothetical protein
MTWTRQWTNSLQHNLVSELIRWSTDSSMNWFITLLTCQQTDSLKHRLVTKLVRCNINSLVNGFAETQNHHWTDLLGHHNSTAKTVLLLITQFGNAYWFAANTEIDYGNWVTATQKSLMQPLSLLIQKLAATMESFLIPLLPFDQA